MLYSLQLTWTAQMVTIAMGFEFSREVLISYLPLSHIAAQMTDIFVPLMTGATVFFAQPDALKVKQGTFIGFS